jgi:hypothetical protein
VNQKPLAKWLMALAACYDYVPQKAAISRYLRILSRWKLDQNQWEELRDRAVMRLTRKFPMPGELHEIALELWQEAELREDSDYLDRMHTDWERQTLRSRETWTRFRQSQFRFPVSTFSAESGRTRKVQ